MPAERIIEEENAEMEASLDTNHHRGRRQKQLQYMATEEEDLKTSLRKELGIGSELEDESPHRFYDWGHDSDGKGAADPSNFLTIEEQIR